MAGLVGVAGAGAIGAKMTGLWGGKQNAQQAPPPAAYPAPAQQWQAGPPAYGALPPQASPPIASAPNSALPLAQQQSGVDHGYGAAALGAGVGAAAAYAGHEVSTQMHHQNSFGPSAAGPGPASAYVNPAVNSGKPPLIIHAAVWSVADITQKIRMLVQPDQTVNIPVDKLVEEFGDPWPESGGRLHKGYAVLYQYGERPMEVLAGKWV
jgi:hypothetical protein